MDYRIFNVRTDVNAGDCTRECTDTVRESALKVDSGRKIPCRKGESNLRRRRAGPMLYQLSYIPIPTLLWRGSLLIHLHVPVGQGSEVSWMAYKHSSTLTPKEGEGGEEEDEEEDMKRNKKKKKKKFQCNIISKYHGSIETIPSSVLNFDWANREHVELKLHYVCPTELNKERLLTSWNLLPVDSSFTFICWAVVVIMVPLGLTHALSYWCNDKFRKS